MQMHCFSIPYVTQVSNPRQLKNNTINLHFAAFCILAMPANLIYRIQNLILDTKIHAYKVSPHLVSIINAVLLLNLIWKAKVIVII